MTFRQPVMIGSLAGLVAAIDRAAAEEFADVALGLEPFSAYCAGGDTTAATGESPFPPAPRFGDAHLCYDVGFFGGAPVLGIVTAHPENPRFAFDPDQAAATIACVKSLE